MDMGSFGEVLKTFRQRKKMSQRAVATALGKHLNTVGGWERGDFLPENRTMVMEIARALHLNDQDTRHLLEASLITVVSRWHVPYHRNPFFTGQEEHLSLLTQTVGKGKAVAVTQAISGLGGIGKTSLVLEFAYRFADQYHAVLWVQAESAETLRTEFARLASVLDLPEQREQDQTRITQAVTRWLASHRGWLLILDNVETLEHLETLVPSRHQGTILLTTRLQVTEPLAPALHVTPMSEDESMLLLLRRAKRLEQNALLTSATSEERSLARALVQEVGGLPLALDQAGAYLLQMQCGLAGYLKLFREQRHHLLSWRGRFAAAHPASVQTTFHVAFKHVEQTHQAAAQVLLVCAFLAPEAIPEELFTRGTAFLGPLLHEVAGDAFRWNEVLEALQALSLVHRDSEAQTLTLHRLVQAVLLDTMSASEQKLWRGRVIAAMNSIFPPVEPGVWQQCERLLTHALACVASEEIEKSIQSDLSHLLFKTARYLHDRVQYAQAEVFYQRALHLREQIPGFEPPDAASIMNSLAILYHEHGKYEQAEPLFQRALQVREQALGSEHPKVAYLLNGLANVYKAQGKYAQAELLYQRTLQIREQALGVDHFLVGHPLNNLADLYREQGKYEQAELLYQRTFRVWEQTLGSKHPLTPAPLEGLATLYLKQGKYEQAEPLFQRALHIWTQVHGPEHPDIASALNGLATLHFEQGQDEQAKLLFQKALHIREQQMGPEHPAVASSLSGLATLYREQGKYVEAEALYRRSLMLREQRLGLEHPDTAEVIDNLARVWEAQDNREAASMWYARALAIRTQVLGAHHPKTMETRNRLIALLHAMGQYEEGVQLEMAQLLPFPWQNEKRK